MPPPNAPPTEITQTSNPQKYIRSYEEPLNDSFQIEAEFSGFQTQPKTHSLHDNPQFLPLSTIDEQYVAMLGISQYHPMCCKVKRMIDSGIERKLIEQYVSGRAQHIVYVISSLSFYNFVFLTIMLSAK